MTIAPTPKIPRQPSEDTQSKKGQKVVVGSAKKVDLDDPQYRKFIKDAPDGATSKVVPGKRGRGRPATGRTPVITIQLPTEMIDRLDSVAKTLGQSRAALIRTLIMDGLMKTEGK